MERSINCKRICLKYEYKHKRNEPKYHDGIKRCCRCCDGIFIKIPENQYTCPCCKAKLRGSPRNKSKFFYDKENEEKYDNLKSKSK